MGSGLPLISRSVCSHLHSGLAWGRPLLPQVHRMHVSMSASALEAGALRSGAAVSSRGCPTEPLLLLRSPPWPVLGLISATLGTRGAHLCVSRLPGGGQGWPVGGAGAETKRAEAGGMGCPGKPVGFYPVSPSACSWGAPCCFRVAIAIPPGGTNTGILPTVDTQRDKEIDRQTH